MANTLRAAGHLQLPVEFVPSQPERFEGTKKERPVTPGGGPPYGLEGTPLGHAVAHPAPLSFRACPYGVPQRRAL